MGAVRGFEEVVCAISVAFFVRYVWRHGFKSLFGSALQAVLSASGGDKLLESKMEEEASKTVQDLFPPFDHVDFHSSLPTKGLTREQILETISKVTVNDIKPEQGKSFAYSYTLIDSEEHYNLIKEVYGIFMHSNALNPSIYPSLRHFENEIVAMTSSFLNSPETARGTMTSCGTESILMAVKTYRDRAKELYGITQPEIILPITAHPAFSKATAYFSVTPVYVNVNSKTKKANVDEIQKAVTKNTILIVLSAPQYPHGTIDPIVEVTQFALSRNIPVHVDSCIGGFFLPFVERLGYNVPSWDFRVPGVTSISADVHKYGFSLKGASVLVFRTDMRKWQYYACSHWPGGLFVSPSALGTRSGGSIAAAWATMVSIGEEGYLKTTKLIYETALWFREQLPLVPGVEIVGQPESSIVAFTVTDVNVFSVADQMKSVYGWRLEVNQDSIHMSVMPSHAATKEKLLEDLKLSIQEVRNNPDLTKTGTAAIYGMVAKVPSTSILELFLKTYMRKVFQTNQ
uniref:sphinganine-1-phosphate aldolase n=1 Tax=Arcella intermedia TaxID=1963864 RepID=A0A6B2L1X5_9EUKA